MTTLGLSGSVLATGFSSGFVTDGYVFGTDNSVFIFYSSVDEAFNYFLSEAIWSTRPSLMVCFEAIVSDCSLIIP